MASARDLAQKRAGKRLNTHMFSEQTVTDMAQMVKNSSFACHELSEPLGTLQMYRKGHSLPYISKSPKKNTLNCSNSHGPLLGFTTERTHDVSMNRCVFAEQWVYQVVFFKSFFFKWSKNNKIQHVWFFFKLTVVCSCLVMPVFGSELSSSVLHLKTEENKHTGFDFLHSTSCWLDRSPPSLPRPHRAQVRLHT